MDSYTSYLNKLAQSIEQEYGIVSSSTQESSDIISVIKNLDTTILSLSQEDIAKRNTEVGKQIVLLSYLCFRLEYFENVRLDYSNFPAMSEVTNLLLIFTDRRRFNKGARQINKLIRLLAEIDKTSMKARYGLGYRFLRIFIVLVMYQSSCNAAIVAKFILTQLVLKAKE